MESSTLNHILITVGVLGGLLIIAPGLIWLERRTLALWQDRYGPNRAGPFRFACRTCRYAENFSSRKIGFRHLLTRKCL